MKIIAQKQFHSIHNMTYLPNSFRYVDQNQWENMYTI